MNLVDCYVMEIIGEPYECYGLWCVDVKYASCGRVSTGTINGLTEEEARNVKKGYVFQN